MYSLSQTGETDLCQIFYEPKGQASEPEFCTMCDRPQFLLVLIPVWNLWENSIWASTFLSLPTPNSKASSRPPESKPDVLIRPKDNKLQLAILSMADHQSTGYKTHLTREILVQCMLMLGRSQARSPLICVCVNSAKHSCIINWSFETV